MKRNEVDYDSGLIMHCSANMLNIQHGILYINKSCLNIFMLLVLHFDCKTITNPTGTDVKKDRTAKSDSNSFCLDSHHGMFLFYGHL